jgi:hypothetical protein
MRKGNREKEKRKMKIISKNFPIHEKRKQGKRKKENENNQQKFSYT